MTDSVNEIDTFSSKQRIEECENTLNQTKIRGATYSSSRIKKVKKKTCCKKTFKGLLAIYLYIIFSSFTLVFVKNNSLNIHPFQSSFIQTTCFIIFIPINSFLFLMSQLKMLQSNNEIESYESQDEILLKVNQNFSEYMDKKFYETYYKYYKTFYLNAIILMAFYYLSQLFLYLSMNSFRPVISYLIISTSSIYIILVKIIVKLKKINCIRFLFLFLHIGIIGCFFISFSYENDDDIKYIKDHLLDLLFPFLSAIFNALFVLYLKRTLNQYKYYMKLSEITGWMGVFSGLIIFVLISFLGFIKIYKHELPSNIEFFFIILKSIFISCIQDMLMIYSIKIFSLSTFTFCYSVINGIIVALYKLYKHKTSYEKIHLILFASGEGLVIALLITSMCKYFSYRNKKKQKNSNKKKRLKE